MLLLAATLASAGVRDDLESALRKGPEAAVACSSVSAARARIDQLVEAASATKTGGIPADARAILDAGAAALGEGTRVAVALWPDADAAVVILGWRPGAQPDFDLVRAGLGTLGTAELVVGDDRAEVRIGTVPELPPRALPAELAAEVPDLPGCLIWGARKAGGLPTDAVIHVPERVGDPGRFVIGLPAAPAGVVLAEPRAPVEVRSAATPIGVVTLGVGVDNVDASSFLEGKALRAFRKVQRALPIRSGSTLALFAVEPSPVAAMVLPMSKPIKAKVVSRRARAVVGAVKKLRIEREDAQRFSVVADKVRVYVSARDGALILASDSALARSLEVDHGEPWLDAATAELASQYTLVVNVSAFPTTPGTRPTVFEKPFRLALRYAPGVLAGQVEIPLSIEEMLSLVGAARNAGKGLVEP